MKKLTLALLVLAAAALTVGAEELGIEVGTDVTAGTLLSETAVTAAPYAAYSTAVAEIDLSAEVGLDLTLSPDFSADDAYLELYAAKALALSEAFTLTPELTVTNTLYLENSDYELSMEPGATAEYGMFTTYLSLPMTLPVGVTEDLYLGLYAEEYISFGDFGITLDASLDLVPDYVFSNFEIFADYAMGDLSLSGGVTIAVEPEVALDNINWEVSYALGALSLGLSGDIYGFGEDQDMDYDQTFSVGYAF